MPDVHLLRADAGRLPLRDGSVHACITSPPYYGLRRYDGPPAIFGGDPQCNHDWQTSAHNPQPHGDNGHEAGLGGGTNTQAATRMGAVEHATCAKCGAWRGQLGLEETPELYLSHLVAIFREVRRVLHAEGTVWIVMGDSYAGGNCRWGGQENASEKQQSNTGSMFMSKDATIPPGLKPKDLMLIPARLALALQADGWYVRSMPPWIKNNPMPESVTDRPTTAHETVLFLSKSARYFYDTDAVRKAGVAGWNGSSFTDERDAAVYPELGTKPREERSGRNRRTSDFFYESLDAAIVSALDWVEHVTHVRDEGGMLCDADGNLAAFLVNTQPYGGAHFATFPEALIEPMIRASTSLRGACPACGRQWRRVVERERPPTRAVKSATPPGQPQQGLFSSARFDDPIQVHTLGFAPACACGLPPHASVILDPFGGTGTTAVVAQRLGRRAVCCDLSEPYLDMARERTGLDAWQRWHGGNGRAAEADLSELPLFAGGEA